MATVLRAICNRNFTVVTSINFFVMIAYYIVFITSTSYAMEAFSLSLSNAGLTAGIMVIGCLAGRFVSGNLLSVLGCRVVLLAGLLLYTLGLSCSFLVDSPAELFIQRLFTGIGVGVVGTATGTIVAYVVPQKYHGLGISLFSMSAVLALALGPFLGIFLMAWLSYPALLKITVAMTLACLALFFLLGTLPHMAKRHRPFWAINSYIDPRVVKFSLVALLLCLGYGCVQAFMSSYAAERELADSAALFFLCYAFSALLTRPLSGSIYDNRGENVIFICIFGLTILALCMLALARTDAVLLLAGIILGMGFGNFQSVGQAVALTLVTKSRFPQATTTFFIFFDFGIGLGPYLFGFVVPACGYTGMYLLLACTVVCAAVLYYCLHGRYVHGR